MTNIYQNLNLITESDVEQKFIIKLLTTESPYGLGYSDNEIKTKNDIRKLMIDKGSKSKLYFPDYVLIVDGVPSIVIEAKVPGDDLVEAIREARLYAVEINSKFKKNVNPCNKIIATDGNIVLATYWDTETNLIEFPVNDIDPVNLVFARFLEFASKKVTVKHADEILKQMRKGAVFFKPKQLLGGKSVINETVGENSFGSNVSLEYKYLFNPDSLFDRENIVNNAYVQSKRRESHISPIDKIIRASISLNHLESTKIEDTKNPKELIAKISTISKLKNELCLLIGDKGSGKSTFTDYLRQVALPFSLKTSTEWININLNKAPLAREMIYDWVVSQALQLIKDKNSSLDFDDIAYLKQIYAKEISKLEKGPASLYPKGSEKYVDIIYNELVRLQRDNNKTFDCIVENLYCKKNKLLVIVFDNCDKRNRDEQLLMFEVATWLKDQFACMIFLPLRDSTYDQYCHEPPLDTVIKDLVFRIDPPLLEKVIYERLNYAIREIGNNSRKFYYSLENGVRVECSRNEVGTYLKSIIASLFQDTYFKRIITGIAGRNIRKGLEIVLDFCKSGFIVEDEIFKIRQSNGEYKLPPHLVSKILIKGKNKYYGDDLSTIKNLFYSDASDSLPDPFVRIAVLNWLKSIYREFGPNKTKGYHKVSELIGALQALGHAKHRIIAEVETLVVASCVVTESLNTTVCEEDLVSIAPAGFVHLDLMKNVSYLASVSEDTFFRENLVAKEISEIISGGGKYKHLSKQSSNNCGKILIDYMSRYYDEFFPKNDEIFLDASSDNYLHLDVYRDFIKNILENNTDSANQERLILEYPPGTLVEAQIVSIQKYGLFVEFGLNATGLIHISKTNNPNGNLIELYDEGEWLQAIVTTFATKHNKFNLKECK